MAYRFNLSEAVDVNVHRILNEQLEKTRHQLTYGVKQEPASAIHDTRKRLKKSRSVLRLIRKSLDKETYKQEKNCLRDAGRVLAPVRDSEVYQETLGKLLESNLEMIDIEAFSDIQLALLNHHLMQLRSVIDEGEPILKVQSSVEGSIDRLRHLQLDDSGWDAIRKNLKKIYRQGQERCETAYREGDDSAFHEWRKRVKDLWYDTRLLESTWPSVMGAFESETHVLSKYLGDDHDIAELRQFLLCDRNDGIVRESQLGVLLPLMDRHQDCLRRQAYDLGGRLYAEAPAAFIDRMERYWASNPKTKINEK